MHVDYINRIRPNYRTVRLSFSKLVRISGNRYPPILKVHLKNDQRGTFQMILMRSFCVFFPNFLYKSIYCGYPFELHRQVGAIQMGTHNICLYNEVDKKVHWLLSEDYGIT